MAVSVSDFRTRFPEFTEAVAPDPRVELFIGDAEIQVDEVRWDKFYNQGVAYLAAHLLSISLSQDDGEGEGASSAGPIYSETVGPLNEKRAVKPVDLNSGDAQLSSTSYGLRYLELRGLIPNFGYLVTSDAQYSDTDLR